MLTHIREGLEVIGLPEPVVRTFPFDKVLFTALKLSNHWSELAIQWLESGYPVSPEIALEFPELVHVVRWQKERMDQITNA